MRLFFRRGKQPLRSIIIVGESERTRGEKGCEGRNAQQGVVAFAEEAEENEKKNTRRTQLLVSVSSLSLSFSLVEFRKIPAT